MTTVKPVLLRAVAGITLRDIEQCERRDFALAALCTAVALAPQRFALNAPVVALSPMVAAVAFILKVRGASIATLRILGAD